MKYEELLTSSETNTESRTENVKLTRKSALSNLRKQASKMLDISNVKYPVAKIGDTVRVRVCVDQARSGEKNVIVIVIEITGSNLYRSEAVDVILNQLYKSIQFTI